MSKSLSAVIVNFNAGEHLSAAVASALAQEPRVAEVVVVDNGSQDGSIARLRECCVDSRLRVLELGANRGFAHASNLGMRATSGEAVLLLNPDCVMFPGALGELLQALDANPDALMAGPLLLNPDGTEQRGGRRDIPNPWQIFCYTIGLHRLMPRHPRFRSFNKLGEPLPAGSAVVPAISGACMLVRREAIETIGGFDEATYFLHFEDLDWCFRVTQAGKGVLFVPGAVVEHTQGVCSASRPVFVEYHKHRSLIRFLRKHFSGFYPAFFMRVVGLLVWVHLAMQVVRIGFLGGRRSHMVPRLASGARTDRS